MRCRSSAFGSQPSSAVIDTVLCVSFIWTLLLAACTASTALEIDCDLTANSSRCNWDAVEGFTLTPSLSSGKSAHCFSISFYLATTRDVECNNVRTRMSSHAVGGNVLLFKNRKSSGQSAILAKLRSRTISKHDLWMFRQSCTLQISAKMGQFAGGQMKIIFEQAEQKETDSEIKSIDGNSNER